MLRPLYVDLDQTLVQTDTLHETILALIRTKRFPLSSLWWLLRRGRAYFKQRLCALATLDVATLPYHQQLVTDLKAERDAGRLIFLATGADQRVANIVAEHLGIFSGVLASDGERNLVGAAKRSAIQSRLGSAGFDYIGNSHGDIAIWQAADGAVVVNPSRLLLRRLRRSSIPLRRVYRRSLNPALAAVRALRIHNWSKNTLIFVALLLSHRVAYFGWKDIAAFLAFCFTASSVYVINDLFDVQFDRKHPTKRNRPFAAGDLSTAIGIVLFAVLVVLALVMAAFQQVAFQGWLVAYLLIAVSYSYQLKKILFLDAMALATLYTIRILAGGSAAHVVISPWTLGFSIFVFLSLASVERISEMERAGQQGTIFPGQVYRAEDTAMLCGLGVAAGYSAVLVLALYISSPDVQRLYSRPAFLWLVCPCLLYWISRLWLLAHRGQIDADPVLFALKDRTSLVIALVILAIGIIAL